MLIPTVSESDQLLQDQIEKDVAALVTAVAESIETGARSGLAPKPVRTKPVAPSGKVLPIVIAQLNSAGWVAYPTRDNYYDPVLAIVSPSLALQKLRTARGKFAELLALLETGKKDRRGRLSRDTRSQCAYLLRQTEESSLGAGVDIEKETASGWESFVDSLKARSAVTARFDEWEASIQALPSGKEE